MPKTLELQIESGDANRLGAEKVGDGWNFGVVSGQERPLSLKLFDLDSTVPFATVPLENTGTVWHRWVGGLPEQFAYSYEVEGGESGLLDPRARILQTSRNWNEGHPLPTCRAVAAELPAFDWQEVPPPQNKSEELIIYEMHVRGFTRDPSSKADAPGTFLGVIEKIPHLLDLDVNAVELMPVSEFFESEYRLYHSVAGLCNYWGYSPINWFAPMGRYTKGSDLTAPITEFRTMVRELHRAGISVILDVVYNHTGEGSPEGGPTLSYRGLDEEAYYLKNPDGSWNNASGCGNTVRCAHPAASDLILDSLRYWVAEMGVDGFRFDLATILNRDENGHVHDHTPLVDRIANDPLLTDTLLIAEPWDAEGRYQVGSFGQEGSRWKEWNDRFRDDVREFIRGSEGMAGAFAQRLSGSADLFADRDAYHSINFVTCHDGFTLADLVSYEHKHNEPNGEENRDGTEYNASWNCGVEGESDDPEIMAIRRRQEKNLILALMIAKGIPMLLMGDEYGHSRAGNNNAWCHDSEINWMQWKRLEQATAQLPFFKRLIELRKTHPALAYKGFLTHDHVSWHGCHPNIPDWSSSSRLVAMTMIDPDNHKNLYVAFNANHHEYTVHLPDGRWDWLVDTYMEEGWVEARGRAERSITIQPYSAIVLEQG